MQYFELDSRIFNICPTTEKCAKLHEFWTYLDSAWSVSEDGTIEGKEVKAGDFILTRAYRCKNDEDRFVIVKPGTDIYNYLKKEFERSKSSKDEAV